MTDQKPVENDERATRNRGLQEEAKRQQDPETRAPRTAREHDVEPDRPAAPDKAGADDIAHLENPPQTDGPRERSNDGV